MQNVSRIKIVVLVFCNAMYVLGGYIIIIIIIIIIIMEYSLLTIDNLYIPVYLYIDMFYILWVYNPLGSIEHEIN